MTTNYFKYNFMAHDFFYYDTAPGQTVDAAQQATHVVKSAGAINLANNETPQDRKSITRTCYIPDPVTSPIGSTDGLNAVEMRVREAVKWDGVDKNSPGFPLLVSIMTYASEHPNDHFDLLFTLPTAKYIKEHPTILLGFKNIHIQSCGTGEDVIHHIAKNTPFGYLASEQHTELMSPEGDAEMSEEDRRSESGEEDDGDDGEFVPPEHESESDGEEEDSEGFDAENGVETMSTPGNN
jgi:hypothetical protein